MYSRYVVHTHMSLQRDSIGVQQYRVLRRVHTLDSMHDMRR